MPSFPFIHPLDVGRMADIPIEIEQIPAQFRHRLRIQNTIPLLLFPFPMMLATRSGLPSLSAIWLFQQPDGDDTSSIISSLPVHETVSKSLIDLYRRDYYVKDAIGHLSI